jgi:hypothetical protein
VARERDALSDGLLSGCHEVILHQPAPICTAAWLPPGPAPSAYFEDVLDAIGAIRWYTAELRREDYFGVDLDIIWDVVANKLPALEARVRRILDL